MVLTNVIACAGVMTQKPGLFGGYSLSICGDVVRKIVRYAGEGTPTEIARGSVATSSEYRVHVVANGTTQGITVNGGNLHTTIDASYADTTSIALVVDGDDASGLPPKAASSIRRCPKAPVSRTSSLGSVL